MHEVPNYPRLSRKVVATTLCLSLAPLLALGLSLYALFQDSIKANLMDSIRTLTESRRNTIDLFLNERMAQLETLAHTHSIAELRDERYLGRVLNLVQARGKSFIDLGVVDEAGNHVAYVGPYHLEGLNAADEQWFREAVTQGAYVSDVLPGFGDEPHFIIAVLRREEDRSWVLRTTMATEVFNALLDAAGDGAGGDSLILSSEGIPQTLPRSGRAPLDCVDQLDLSDFSGIRVNEATVHGRQALVASTWLKSKDWVLVTLKATGEKLTPRLLTYPLVLGLGAGGLLLIVLAAILVNRHVLRQLAQANQDKEDLVESHFVPTTRELQP